jgi:hypothetical protein
MKQTSVFQIVTTLLTLGAVKCVPASKQAASPSAPGTDLSRGGGNNLLQTMGPVEESNCRGNKMTWTKNKVAWEKLQLAKNLNLYQNVWQGKYALQLLVLFFNIRSILQLSSPLSPSRSNC